MGDAETAATDVRAALAAGDLPGVGARPPFICATRIAVGDPARPVDAAPDRQAQAAHDGGS
jgi:hypothetical protein